MKAKHTPAPWEVVIDSTGVQVATKEICVAYMCTLSGRPVPVDEVKANARLIASSPMMLEALEQTYNAICELEHENGDNFHELDEVMELIEQAIARATGADGDA
jgi:hypothetical protein